MATQKYLFTTRVGMDRNTIMVSGDYMEYDDVNHVITMYPSTGDDKVTARIEHDLITSLLDKGWIQVTGVTPGGLVGDVASGAPVALGGSLPAGSNVIGGVTQSGNWFFAGVQDNRTTGTITNATSVVGPAMSVINSAATTNATSIKASAGTVFSILVSNTGGAAAFVKLYNKASAPTVGTDVPVITISVPASGTVTLPLGVIGVRFTTGIALAITNLAADSDTTAVAANQVKSLISYI